jgi:NitT/TauT family transport system substrate-binding protein
VPDTERNGYGWMTREKMQRSVDFMAANIEIQGKRPTVDHVMREGFLPKDPVRP